MPKLGCHRDVHERHIWQHPLRLVLDFNRVRKSVQVEVTSLNYSMAEHSVGSQVQERYHGVPQWLDLYILQGGQQWISLSPFISICHCPRCETRETYFVDAWKGSGQKANLRS